MDAFAVISIGIDPMVRLGPVTLAWHGLTIAIGILVGGLMAAVEARARGLDAERLQVMGIIPHPDADVPSHVIAYHSGGLYESLIGFATFAVAFALHRRLRARPTAMIWLVIALLGLGRFVEFFARSDSATSALGLETAQWTSVGLLLIAAAGAWTTARSRQPTQ